MVVGVSTGVVYASGYRVPRVEAALVAAACNRLCALSWPGGTRYGYLR